MNPQFHTTRHRRRGTRSILASGSLVLLMAISGCGQQRQPTEYGDKYKENFMLGCTGVEKDGDVPAGGKKLASKSYCECVYRGLREKVPFDDARKFEQQQSEDDPDEEIEVPKNIQAVFDDCEGEA